MRRMYDSFGAIEDGKNDPDIPRAQAAKAGEWAGERFVALRLVAEFFGDGHGHTQGFGRPKTF